MPTRAINGRRQRQHPEEVRQAVCQLHQDGHATDEIERRTGVSQRTICIMLIAAGLRQVQRRIPPEAKAEACRLYAEGVPLDEIVRVTGLSQPTVNRAARRAGLEPRHQKLITNSGEQEVLRLREEGLSTAQIVADTGLPLGTVQRVLRVAGKAYKKQTAGRVRRRHSLDERFFDCIDTPQKAYALGFITADGHVGPGMLAVGVQTRDRAVLEFLRDALGSTAPIADTVTCPKRFVCRGGKEFHVAPRPVSTVTFCSANLAESIGRLGLNLVGNKTFDALPWPGDGVLDRFYWAGLVDGDGSVGFSTRQSGNVQWRVRLCGNRQIVGGFAEFVQRSGVASRAQPHPHENIWEVAYTGAAAEALLRLLYTGIDFGLERKRLRAAELLRPDAGATLPR